MNVTPDWKRVLPGGIGRKKPNRGGQRALRRARTIALVRSAGICEALTPACKRYGTEFHHVLPRSRGGQHEPGNGLYVCAPCHRFIHDHPAISRQAGWLR
jgi:hypothetical protein